MGNNAGNESGTAAGRRRVGHPDFLFHLSCYKITEGAPSAKDRPVTNLLQRKAIPLKALTGPDGSRRLRISYVMTIGT
jgi:hypothetical protein